MCSMVAANSPLSRTSSAKPSVNPRDTRQTSSRPSPAARHPLSQRMRGLRSAVREHAIPTEPRSSRKPKRTPGMTGASAHRDMAPQYGTIPQLPRIRVGFSEGAGMARRLRFFEPELKGSEDDSDDCGGVPGGRGIGGLVRVRRVAGGGILRPGAKGDGARDARPVSRERDRMLGLPHAVQDGAPWARAGPGSIPVGTSGELQAGPGAGAEGRL